MRASPVIVRLGVVLLASVALAGCNMPRGAGQTRQILRGADSADANFAVVNVTRESVARVRGWPAIGSEVVTQGWLPRKRGPVTNVIGPGDQLALTIWETDDVSLLSAPGQKHSELPAVVVGADGSVFLPYAERVYVANMTPEEARAAIQARLETIMPSAQVLLAHTPGRRSTVDLVSGVRKPGTFPLPDRDFTVLGLVALGGGIPEDMANPSVRLIRDGKLYGIAAEQLFRDPALDTTLRGGDKVYVEPDDRYFIALGSSAKQAQLPFTQQNITALEALSMSAGLTGNRADAKGVLVLRDYPAPAVRGDGSGPPKERVVFVIDLTSADGLFSAGEFAIQNRDVVVVAESPLTSTTTILGLIGSVMRLGNTAQDLGN